ncbi:MAG: uncharacterized protein A8A55_2854 [Amphiamblys sp. WSBS2006]|nr:MAG: uncharacterized protein A8A55_2854 [Amphiamblys sp. WSBS2006]
MMLGAGIAAAAVRRDLGTPPIKTIAACLQRRLRNKSETVATTLRFLEITKERKGIFWSCRLRSELKNRENEAGEVFGKESHWASMDQKEKAKAWKRYHEKGMVGTGKQFLLRSGWFPDLGMGWRKLGRLRCSFLWTGTSLASAELVPEILKTLCPSCNKEERETGLHLIRDCTRWEQHRGRADKRTGISKEERENWLNGTSEEWELCAPTAGLSIHHREIWLAALLTYTSSGHEGALRKYKEIQQTEIRGRPRLGGTPIIA